MEDRTVIWDKQGRVAVQVYGDRLFDARGNTIGWVRGEGVYDRTGRHIGWLLGGILRDMYGKVMGFTENVSSGQPHPPLPQEKEGAPPLSLEGPTQEKPGLMGAPGLPLMGGKPPLGASWSSFEPQEYFESH